LRHVQGRINRIKPKIFGFHVSKVRRIIPIGEVVAPTIPTSQLEGLQGNGNSRLLGANGCRRQLILKINPLKVTRKLLGSN
jgi:hypothetical protein